MFYLHADFPNVFIELYMINIHLVKKYNENFNHIFLFVYSFANIGVLVASIPPKERKR